MAYQKILVAIDDSEISDNVIQQAAQLAKALNSEITLVQVMTLDPYLADAYLRMGQSNELIERVRSYVQENLTKAEKKFEALGLTVA
ncbi:MAG: universal stress protein, partial [Acinetobacter sp.]|nr:universal stress protein [Acinetobacter sp.]